MNIFATGNLYAIKDNDWEEFLSNLTSRVKKDDTLIIAGKSRKEQLQQLEEICPGLIVTSEACKMDDSEIYWVKDGSMSSIWKQGKNKSYHMMIAHIDSFDQWEETKKELEKYPSVDCIIFSSQSISQFPEEIDKHKQVKIIAYANRSISFDNIYQGKEGFGAAACQVTQIDVRFLENKVTLLANMSDYGFLSVKDAEMSNAKSLSWKYAADNQGEHNQTAIVDKISYHNDILYHPVNKQTFLQWLEEHKTSRLNQLEETQQYAKFLQSYAADELLEFILLREKNTEVVSQPPTVQVHNEDDKKYQAWMKFMRTQPVKHMTVKQIKQTSLYHYDYKNYQIFWDSYAEDIKVEALLKVEEASPQIYVETTEDKQFLFDTLSQLRATGHPYYLEYEDFFSLFEEVLTPNQIMEKLPLDDVKHMEDILWDIEDIDIEFKELKEKMHLDEESFWGLCRDDISVGELLNSFFMFPDIMLNGLPINHQEISSIPQTVPSSVPSAKTVLKKEEDWQEVHQKFWDILQNNPDEQELHDWVEEILEEYSF